MSPHPDGLHRPEPLDVDTPAELVRASDRPEAVARDLIAGERRVIDDVYSTGLKIIAALKKQIQGAHPGDSFDDRRAFRSAFRAAEHRLLVRIRSNKIDLGKAPDIGWLTRLYPDVRDFVLPFPEVQGLNSAWQWRLRGLAIEGLRQRIHPFYGTYFPTRFDHLALFDEWLTKHPLTDELFVDVGVGAGILTLMILERSAARGYATDINPNAIESTRIELKRAGFTDRAQLETADLFGALQSPAKLIVFNPPWLPGQSTGPLDQAIYFDDDLFERFFAAASTHLAADGQLVLLFSNLSKLNSMGARHPVRAELADHRRFQLVERLTKTVKAGSKKTKRSTAHRAEEEVELWVLSK